MSDSQATEASGASRRGRIFLTLLLGLAAAGFAAAWLTEWQPWHERHHFGTSFFEEVTDTGFVETTLRGLGADPGHESLDGQRWGGWAQGRVAEGVARIPILKAEAGPGAVVEGLHGAFLALLRRHGGTQDGGGHPLPFSDDRAWFEIGFHVANVSGAVHVLAHRPPAPYVGERAWDLLVVIYECRK